jgi:hypothetical protein
MDREAQIAKRRSRIPNLYDGAYRKKYDKAIEGNSLRAACDSFCLECVQWEKEEVKKCTDLGCPLYPYRPYKE